MKKRSYKSILTNAMAAVFLMNAVAATLCARPSYAATPTTVENTDLNAPSLWLMRDIDRNAEWLPTNIVKLGWEKAYQTRFYSLSVKSQKNLTDMNIPHWLIALIPMDGDQNDIRKQLDGMDRLAGTAPDNKYARRLEQLMVFIAAAHFPTPGDHNGKGKSLGNEGCSAAISRELIAQLLREYPELARQAPGEKPIKNLMPRLTDSQDSQDLETLFTALQTNGYFKVRKIPFHDLKPKNFKPGQIIIAHKPGGTHMMFVTRVAEFFGWPENNLSLDGNSWLKEQGAAGIFQNQEYIGEGYYNPHGPFYSHNRANIVMPKGAGPATLDNPNYLYALLADRKTNVYGVMDDLHHNVMVTIIEAVDPRPEAPAPLPAPPAYTSETLPYSLTVTLH